LAGAGKAAAKANVEADEASAGLSCMTHVRKVGAAIGAALATVRKQSHRAARGASGLALCSVGGFWSIDVANPEWDAHEKLQADLLRCLFSNPFRPAPSVNPAWLKWHNSAVVKLAQGIYADQSFDRLPILADALEEAGCDDPDMLDHLRGPTPHARGCWVVDALLGKE
jgi:hypothetical protein